MVKAERLFSEVFRNSGREGYWYVGISGFNYYGRDQPPGGRALGSILDRFPLLQERWAGGVMDSPVNVWALKRSLLLLDGKIVEESCPSGFPPVDGVWVSGMKVARFLCYEIGIKQPRRWPGEQSIPSHDELLADLMEVPSESSKNMQDSITAPKSPNVSASGLAGVGQGSALPPVTKAKDNARTCFYCTHRRAKRTSMFSGKAWCELENDGFPKTCDQFERV